MQLALSATMPASGSVCWIWNQGAPIAMPSALASLQRAMAQPSLLLSTMTGWPCKLGRNALAGHVEIVAVDQRVHGRGGSFYFAKRLMATVTTLHMINYSASLKPI